MLAACYVCELSLFRVNSGKIGATLDATHASTKKSPMIIVMNRQLIENASSTVMHDLISNADVSKIQYKNGTLRIKVLIDETSGTGDQLGRATHTKRSTCSSWREMKISYQLAVTSNTTHHM